MDPEHLQAQLSSSVSTLTSLYQAVAGVYGPHASLVKLPLKSDEGTLLAAMSCLARVGDAESCQLAWDMLIVSLRIPHTPPKGKSHDC